MTNLPKDGEELPDKEVVSLGTNENKTPATSSEGEYSEEKKQVISAMKAHYGDENITPDDSEYTTNPEVTKTIEEMKAKVPEMVKDICAGLAKIQKAIKARK